MNLRSVSDQLSKNSPERYHLPLIVWIAGQLASIGKKGATLAPMSNCILYFRLVDVEMQSNGLTADA